MALLDSRRGFFWVAVILFTATQSLSGQTLSIDEGIELAFPGSEFERKTVFLNEAQKEEARILALSLIHI